MKRFSGILCRRSSKPAALVQYTLYNFAQPARIRKRLNHSPNSTPVEARLTGCAQQANKDAGADNFPDPGILQSSFGWLGVWASPLQDLAPL